MIRHKQHQIAVVTIAIVVGGIVAWPAQVQAVGMRASLSSSDAYVGLPITLQIEINDAQQQEQPTLSDIDGLDVRSSGAASRSSQTTIINGHRTERTSVTYAWQLTPRRAGEFVVPPISVSVNGRPQQTRALQFTASKSETGDLMFVEVDGQADSIYVGQPLDLTLRIWVKPYHDAEFGITLSESDMWQLISHEHSNWGAFSGKITELAQNRQRVRGRIALRPDGDGNEQRYYRYDVDATIYPKRPGNVDAGDVQIVAKYPTALARSRSFFSMGEVAIRNVRPIVADATVSPIEVAPVPTEGQPTDYRGTVGKYEIVTQATPHRVKAGDPITLHIGIRGNGPMELVQAPPLADLPQLTADFKVPDEALAGHVKGDVKIFSLSVRPRREDVMQIPAIPLSYFDPDVEAFVTVHSEPIAIEVDAADQLSLSAVVGGSAAPGSTAPSSDEGLALALTNVHSPGVLESQTAGSLWTMVLWLSLAPFAYLAALCSKHREKFASRISSTRLAAQYRARLALRDAHTPPAVATAVLRYVGELYEMPMRSLTRDDAINCLRKRVEPRIATHVDELLAECEAYCYGGHSSADVESLARKAATCIELLSRRGSRRRRSVSEKPIASRRTRARRKAITAGCVLLTVLSIVTNGVLYAGELSGAQSAQILAEAGEAYALGRAATEPADAKESFAIAAQKYQTLVNDGVDNGQLYLNLGNAYLQAGDGARALANYERASELMPGDEHVRRNSAHAQALLGVASPRPSGFVESAKTWLSGVSPSVLLASGVAAWSLMWAALVGQLVVRRRLWRWIAFPALICFAATVAAVGWQRSQTPTTERVMIVADSTMLRTGNGHGFAATTGQPLPIGHRFQLVDKRDHWFRIQLDNGESGWVADDQAERLPARATQG